MRKTLLVLAIVVWCGAPAFGAATFVNGLVPDWNQPIAEGAGAPVPPGGWAAWCAPTSAANLVGHWEDARNVLIADGAQFPNSNPVNYGAGASWKDYLADGFARPAANAPLPAAATDHGWYMDTNRGGQALNPGLPGAFAGTRLKDIHVGLGAYLNTRQPGAWTTGTQGKAFAAGLNSAGLPAMIHPNAATAFAEIVNEINANRTLLVSWLHWNIRPGGFGPMPGGGQGEAAFGGEYYEFEDSYSGDPWGNGEEWNGKEDGEALGHVVTAVGYIPAGDPADPTGNTNWVIVHDNVKATPRNVIVPMNWMVWVANTNAVPEPATICLLGLAGLALLRRRQAY